MGIVQAIFVAPPAASDDAAAAAGKGGAAAAAAKKKPVAQVQLRVVVHGCDTVLGDAASDAELFVTPRFAVFPLADAAEKLDASRRRRRWDPTDTALHAAEALEDERLREGNNEKLAAGRPLSYIYRTAYLPLKGMFQILPSDLGLGRPAANEPAPEKGLAKGRPAVKAAPAKGVAAAQSATPRIDRREARQEARIHQGVRSGELTRGGRTYRLAQEDDIIATLDSLSASLPEPRTTPLTTF